MDGLFMEANQAFLNILGYSLEQLQKISYLDVTPKSYAYDEARQLESLALHGSYGPYEKEYIHANGQLVLVRLNGVLVTDSHGNTSVWSIIEDITHERLTKTKQHELESQLRHVQKMETIGRLAGGLAHDLNNILTPVAGYAALLRENQPDGSKDAGRLDRITTAVKRAANLVSQLLLISRKDEGEPSPIILSQPVGEALNLLTAVSMPTVTFHFSDSAALWPVMADPTRIHQVIMNLCVNAAQAIGDKIGNVWVRLENITVPETPFEVINARTPGRWVRISVEDDGPGMSKDLMERITEPFFTTKKESGGSGLGLSIVEGIVAQAGGKLTIYSEVGEGSVFHIWLPTCDGKEDTQNISPPLNNACSKGETVLLVDDEHANLDVISDYLHHSGYQVRQALSAEGALQALTESRHTIDLVITDFAMPGMDGAALARRIRTRWPHIPVIMMSGFSSKINSTNKSVYGVDRFISKPLDFLHLLTVIRELLETPSAKEVPPNEFPDRPSR